MRYLAFVSVALMAMACKSYPTVDEACSDKLAGEKAISNPDDVDTLLRLNCYRRLAKAGKAPLDKALQESAESHLAYMEAENMSWSEGDLSAWNREDPGKANFTGEDVFARWENAGGSGAGSYEVFELGLWDPTRGGEIIDTWMYDPWVRPVFLTPNIFAAASAQMTNTFDDGTDIAYLIFAYPLNVNPVMETKLYPVDGQEDVPASWTPESSSAPSELYGKTWGYPLTIITSRTERNVAWKSVTLETEGGELVAFQSFTPSDGSFFGGFQNTLVAVPEEPMTDGVTYHFFGEITSDLGERKFDITFTVDGSIEQPSLF